MAAAGGSDRLLTHGHENLRVFQLAYDLAIEIFALSKRFPVDERYSLTGQVRRSSLSVAANIAEAYRKRQYPKVFVNKLSDAARRQKLRCGYGSLSTASIYREKIIKD